MCENACREPDLETLDQPGCYRDVKPIRIDIVQYKSIISPREVKPRVIDSPESYEVQIGKSRMKNPTATTRATHRRIDKRHRE